MEYKYLKRYLMIFILLILFTSVSIAENYVVNSARAHFHSQPNISTKKKSYIILGDKVRLLESEIGWAKVIYKQSNTVGWVRTELLSVEKLVNVTCARAYFHDLPHNDSKRKAYVIEDDEVQVLKELDDWKKVIFYGTKKNTVGWIKNSCLQTSTISDLDIILNNYSDIELDTDEEEKPKVWALIVGVSDYSALMNERGVNDLSYSDDDAHAMYDFLKSPNGGRLPYNQIKLLMNSDATRTNILFYAKKLFNQAKSNDLIIFYFSGHGGNNVFVAHDKNVSHTEIKSILKQSEANKKLCVADACHSGSLAKTKSYNKVLSNSEMITNYYNALSSSSDGIALFLSSKADEYSIEVGDFGQGVFTHYYIEGLKGYADEDYNGIITIQELYEYTKDNVIEYTRSSTNLQQPQLKGTFDHDMPIGVTN